MNKFLTYSALALAPLLLTQCGGKKSSAREVLGLERQVPDEFSVVSRPPLSVPKEFYLLPPSYNERAVPAAQRADIRAEALVTGRTVDDLAPSGYTAATNNPSPAQDSADAALLNRVGISKADPNIRQTLAKETATLEDDTLWDAVRGNSTEEPVVDASKEATRLIDNKESGAAVNAGEVPVIDPAKASPLQQILKRL